MDFGSDFSTFQPDGTVDLDPLFPLLTSERVALEDCARRLMTPRGFLKGLPNYGLDLRSKLGMRMSATAKIRLGAEIEAQLLLSERVQAIRIVEFADRGQGRYRLRIKVTLATGPFDLVVEASALTVELLEISSG